jgi:hypothetical protein
MSIAADGLAANQVVTLRVHTAHPEEEDLSVTAHADERGVIAYANWHVFGAPGSYALGVEVSGVVVATATVEVA